MQLLPTTFAEQTEAEQDSGSAEKCLVYQSKLATRAGVGPTFVSSVTDLRSQSHRGIQALLNR